MKGGIYIKFSKKCDQCRLVVLAQELLPFFPQRIIGKSVTFYFYFFFIVTTGKGRCTWWGKAADAVKYFAKPRTAQHHDRHKHTNTNTRAQEARSCVV